MVEYTINVDAVFSSLADATRRDILSRVSNRSWSVGELAEEHPGLTFAAVAKHIKVLEEAELVIKERDGRYQIIRVNPKTIKQAHKILQQYQIIWEARLNQLDSLLH